MEGWLNCFPKEAGKRGALGLLFALLILDIVSISTICFFYSSTLSR